MKITQTSLILGGIILTFIIATGASLITSYTNLKNLAEMSGINNYSSYIWPFCLDFVMILGCIASLYYSIIGKKSYHTYAYIILFTIATVYLNVVSPSEIISRVVHGIPPLALFASMEIAIELIRTYMNPKNNGDLPSNSSISGNTGAIVLDKKKDCEGTESVNNFADNSHNNHIGNLNLLNREQSLNLDSSHVKKNITRIKNCRNKYSKFEGNRLDHVASILDYM